MKSFRIRDAMCLLCGYHTTHAADASGKDDKAPVPGDLSVCLSCGALMEFDEELKHKPIGTSIDSIPGLSPETRQRIAATVAAIKKRGRLKGPRAHLT
jgi:hypothetical protein